MDTFINTIKTRPTSIMIVGHEITDSAMFNFVEYIMNQINPPNSYYVCDNSNISHTLSDLPYISKSTFLINNNQTLDTIQNYNVNITPIGNPSVFIFDTVEKLETNHAYIHTLNMQKTTCIRLIKLDDFKEMKNNDLDLYDYLFIMPPINFLILLTGWNHIYNKLQDYIKIADTASTALLFKEDWKKNVFQSHIWGWRRGDNYENSILFKYKQK